MASSVTSSDITSSQQYSYNLALLGDHGVGKTSLFNRMKTGEFIEVHTLSSRDGESWCYTTTLGDDTVKVRLILSITVNIFLTYLGACPN